MKKIILIIIASIFTSTVAFAAPPAGKGPNKKPKITKHVNKTVPSKKAFKKTNNLSTNLPPGLRDKDLPPGLSKKDKTPPGWSQGEKRGWEDNRGPIRRAWDRFVGFFTGRD